MIRIVLGEQESELWTFLGDREWEGLVDTGELVRKGLAGPPPGDEEPGRGLTG